VRSLRNLSELAKPDPNWLRPPARASYPVVTSRNRTSAVEFDPTAQEWIERLRVEPRRRIGPMIRVKVWLSRDEPSGRLIVHSGEQRVGLIRRTDEAVFDKTMRAAAIFDEDPVVDAVLAAPADRDWAVLEIRLPDA
jgi:hypothetical protein